MRRLTLVIMLSLTPMLLAQGTIDYHVTHMYELGGDGAWDYIVPSHDEHRVYIGRTNRVMVVDENDGRLVGEVMGIKGAHGTAIAQSSGHGFATSGNDQSIVMFDLKTFKELARIPAAEDADAIIYDAPSNRVFSLNGDAHSSTVVDAASGKVVATVALGGKPEYGASAGDGKVYTKPDRHERGGRDRREECRCRAPLADDALPSTGVDGHRHDASSSVQRLPKRYAGGVGLPGGQDDHDRGDWDGRRRRRIRCGGCRRICEQRGRNVDRDPSGLGG